MTFLWLWRRELAYICLFIIIAAILSCFTGFFLNMVVLILVSVIFRQAILLSRLILWLSSGAGTKAPETKGIWNDIYYHIYRIRKTEKQRKKKLGKIIEQFRKSTDVLPDAAIVLGRYNEIEWSNKLAKIVLGIKKSDRGQRIDNLIRSPEFVAFLKNKDEKKSLTMPSPNDDKIILQYRIVNYGISQHLVIAHDVTQQKNIEEMRKNFVDNVSHELRTPITVLKGYVEALQSMEDNQSIVLKNSLKHMHSQTERMQYLVDDLLLLARLETQQKKNDCVITEQLIRKICAEKQSLEKNTQRFELSLDPDCKIIGVEQELQSAFTNLLVNALKYSEDDTTIKVILKKKNLDIIFDVIDQGEGISPVHIPRITERFYRIDINRSKSLRGTGLGLAIVKHVLIRHDAKLEITSKLGKGSRFRCIFPATRAC